ncbi:MAG: hypothetical protein HY393_01140 [Candidatus Diapherotrites archaeon]|nr:hypothetical protein [Candidatus Diapherotrites archaeon]
MQLVVSDEIFKQYPGTVIGIILARGMDNTRESPEMRACLRVQEKRVCAEFALETLSRHPRIACWRAAYQKFGAKASEYRSSIENLYRRILKGEEIRSINPLVDAYNVVSLTHALPVGGEDLDKTRGTIEFCFAGENEKPVQLLGENEARPPHKGEVIYRDEEGTLCRRWNWKEAERTKLTPTTKNALLVVEGIPPITEEDVKRALDELENLTAHLGGTRTRYILSKSQPIATF